MLNSVLTVDEIVDDALGLNDGAQSLWTPNTGAQESGYLSDADVIGYGGAAFGGKSDLQLGMAFTKHWRSAIYRRHYADLSDMVIRGNEILDGAAQYVSGEKKRWELPDGRMVTLAAVQHQNDLVKYRGKGRDFIGIDEAAEFPEDWFRFLTGWVRTTHPGQKTRILLTFNPPQTPDGEWIVRYFAPWLDKDYAGTPALPGELRWYIRRNDQDKEVSGPEPVEIDGAWYKPQSRTFIPARVDDNPHAASDYKSQLNTLPEPLRSQLLFGDFTIRAKDNIWQVIPTAWVLAAQKRWREQQRPKVMLRGLSSDPARGGKDKHAIAKLYGTYFELYGFPGVDTPDGPAGAEQIMEVLGGERAPVFVDVIGIGASVYDHVRVRQDVEAYPVNNSGAASGTDKSGMYEFFNVRAASYWRLREALDPSSGEDIALPDIRELRIDLTAPRYSIVGGRIKVEPKDDIKARIGHSPDDGDAIVMLWFGISLPVVELDFDMNNYRGG